MQKRTRSVSNPSHVQSVALDHLHFDPNNPRLPTRLHTASEEEVLTWMLRDATLVELIASVATQDYFAGEPLLVVPRDGSPGHFLVVEGNRRLAATKLLAAPEKAPARKTAVAAVASEAKFRPTELPVLVYAHRQDVLNYLAFRHITGVKAWSPLAKARYLKQIQLQLPDADAKTQFRELAKTIGSRADYAERLLTGLAVYDQIAEQNFYNIKDLDEETLDFGILTTALSYSNIADFIGIQDDVLPEAGTFHNNELRELAGWMFERGPENKTRLGESRRLSTLNRVIAHKQALEKFRNGAPLIEADQFTNEPTANFSRAIVDARDRLLTARDLQRQSLEPTRIDEETLSEIVRIARAIRASVSEYLTDLDDNDDAAPTPRSTAK